MQASEQQIFDWRTRSNNPGLSRIRAAASTTRAIRSSEEVTEVSYTRPLGIPIGRNL